MAFETPQVWEPDAWQTFMAEVLSLRYGADFAEVPDQVKGDSGIEGFSKDGNVYQCYACEGEPLPPKVRFARQKKKMTRDLAKFVKNQAALKALIGTMKVKRWVFLVPNHESKELVAHATSKAEEIRQLNLPIVDIGFDIRVQTLNAYPQERAILTAPSALGTHYAMAIPKPQELAKIEKGTASIKRLDKKLSNLPLAVAAEQSHLGLRKSLLKAYVQGKQLEDFLRKNWPEVRERYLHRRQVVEQRLPVQLASMSAADNVLYAILEMLKSSFKSAAPILSDTEVETLAIATATDWLMRCPLSFVESNAGTL